MLAELADRNGIVPAGLGDPDAVPQVPDDADLYVEAGDLFGLGRHRVLCGDATAPLPWPDSSPAPGRPSL